MELCVLQATLEKCLNETHQHAYGFGTRVEFEELRPRDTVVISRDSCLIETGKAYESLPYQAEVILIDKEKRLVALHFPKR